MVVSACAANEAATGAAERQSGTRLEDVRLVEPVPVEAIACALALLIGVPAIIAAYCRSWIIHRRGGNISTHRTVILVASVALASTGMLKLVHEIATAFEFMGTYSNAGPAARAMLFLNVAHSFNLFTVSLLAATIGIIACLLLPTEK